MKALFSANGLGMCFPLANKDKSKGMLPVVDKLLIQDAVG